MGCRKGGSEVTRFLRDYSTSEFSSEASLSELLPPGGLFRVITKRCHNPTEMPNAKPVKARNPVPNRRSSHSPAMPGRTISNATVVIRETQAMASAIGDRCSGRLPTGIAQSVGCTLPAAVTRSTKTCYATRRMLAKPDDFADWVASLVSCDQRGLATEVAQSNTPRVGVNDHLADFVFYFTKSRIRRKAFFLVRL